MTDKKIKMKINRYIKTIGKDDLILDNGACIQVVTQHGAFHNWNYSTLIMSKKMFKELDMCGFIQLDGKETAKAEKYYGKGFLNITDLILIG